MEKSQNTIPLKAKLTSNQRVFKILLKQKNREPVNYNGSRRFKESDRRNPSLFRKTLYSYDNALLFNIHKKRIDILPLIESNITLDARVNL